MGKDSEAPKRKCGGKLKTCRNKECAMRFPKELHDVWDCPNCGETRHCENDAMKNNTACRVHGAKGGRPPGAQYYTPVDVQDAVYALLESPDLTSLAFNIALSKGRSDQLMRMIDDADARAARYRIKEALKILNQAIKGNKQGDMDESGVILARGMIEEALQPIFIEAQLWSEWMAHTELNRRLTETENKWLDTNDKMVPIEHVVDVFAMISKVAVQHIVDPAMIASFAGALKVIAPNLKPPSR